jgi:hypothetical protein
MVETMDLCLPSVGLSRGLLLLMMALVCRRQSNAFVPHHDRQEFQYFNNHFVLPPLDKINTTTLVQGAMYDEDALLPVLYTNDPKQVTKWLIDNVPKSGCILGFDTEVCK